MLKIHAQKTFIDTRLYDSPNCLARLQRMMPFIHTEETGEWTNNSLESVRSIGRRRHGKDDFTQGTVLAFTTFDEERLGWFYHWRDEASAHGGACQPGMELNLVDGCAFRCDYCGFGRYIIFYLDAERFVNGLDNVFAQHPEQRLFKYSNTTDLPAFEPELDVIRPVVERFAKEPNRYVMLFTKSDNVSFLEPIPHGGHTIISWSLTCDSASRLVDRRTASMQERIAAMAAAQSWGYRVRARLSPIVPVKDWRLEYRELFETLFAMVQPDLVTLELLGWMDVDDLFAIFDRDLLDPAALRSAELARSALSGVRWGPFTEATHQEIYRYCIDTIQDIPPGTPVALCHGTAASWQALGDTMKMTPDHYLCNCGSLSAPGAPLYDHWNKAS